MSGAHCIDFYNKSTLTFIVIYLCFSSCFLLRCHLLKPSAESFTMPVCICSFRVLLRQVHTAASRQSRRHWGWLRCSDSPWWTCSRLGLILPLQTVPLGRDSREGTTAAPELTAWLMVPCGLQFLPGCQPAVWWRRSKLWVSPIPAAAVAASGVDGAESWFGRYWAN